MAQTWKVLYAKNQLLTKRPVEFKGTIEALVCASNDILSFMIFTVLGSLYQITTDQPTIYCWQPSMQSMEYH